MFKRNETEKDIELIYYVAENEKIDNVSIGMMRNNDIKGLASIYNAVTIYNIFTSFYFKYHNFLIIPLL